MVGLNNLGNTCYLNSVLQCLISTEPLVVYFFGDMFVEECRNTFIDKIKKKNNIDESNILLNTNEINKILKSYISIHLYEVMKYAYNNDNEKKISPSHIYKLIKEKHSSFDNNEQNDSHEILNFILHDIDDEIKSKTNFLDDIYLSESFKKFIETKNDFDNIIKYFNENELCKVKNNNSCKKINNLNDAKNIYYQYIKKNNYFVIVYNSHVYLKKYFYNNYSPIHKIFMGLYCSSVKCLTCDKTKITYEPFISLSLSIDNTSNETSLESCFDNFLKKEYMSDNNKYNCDNCSTYTNACKKMYILKKPNILVIHLKRFDHNSDKIIKNKQIITFPIYDLTVKNNLIEEYDDIDINDENIVEKYNLYAIVCHLGSMEGGHYISFCKNIQNNNWYMYDDSDVKEIEIEMLNKNCITKNVFLLFYQKSE